MRANVVVVLAPSLDYHDRLPARAEPLDAQAFIAQFAVETLVRAVLSGLPRIDERGLNVVLDDPLQYRLADEFGAIVEAQKRRSRAR